MSTMTVSDLLAVGLAAGTAIGALIKFGDRLWKQKEVTVDCSESHRAMMAKIDELAAHAREQARASNEQSAALTSFLKQSEATQRALEKHTEILTELVVTARQQQNTANMQHESVMRTLLERNS